MNRISYALLFLAAAMPAGMLAQSSLNQQIAGRAVDATGAAIHNVSVTVLDKDTGLTVSRKPMNPGSMSSPTCPPANTTSPASHRALRRKLLPITRSIQTSVSK